MISNTKTETRVEIVSRTTHPGHFFIKHWTTILTWTLILGIFILALLMRLHTLDIPIDRDTYDEGVYWQSLRAMSSGKMLYRDIFYSQPPLFLLAIYPFYMLFGQTIFAARLGIALISLTGFVGIALLGKVLAGRLGMVVGLLLLLLDPLYLRESQILQADSPSIALSILAIGLAFSWHNQPGGRRGILWGTATGLVLALSILTKLLAVVILLPIGLLVLHHLWQLWRNKELSRQERWLELLPLIYSAGAFLLTTILTILPYLGAISELERSVITFHTDAAHVYNATRDKNILVLRTALISLLALSALYGTCVALLRRDWRVLPLLAWALITILFLWRQTPLFVHHLVAIGPTLIALALIGLQPLPAIRTFRTKISTRHPLSPAFALPLLALILIGITSTAAIKSIRAYYKPYERSFTQERMLTKDLRKFVPQDKLIITDAPFAVAQADRTTPGQLVDTSQVRINSNYLYAQDLIEEASRPEVAAAFIDGTDRLYKVVGFHLWLEQHFDLARLYNNGDELWVKKY